MKTQNHQRGFAPVVFLLIFAALGITGVGTVAASNSSKPGDALFGLDKAIEEIRVTFAPDDEAIAKVRIAIADERIDELQSLDDADEPVNPALAEAQLAVNNAATALNTVETKIKENKITLKSSDLQALLTELQNLLTTHQGLIKKIEIKVEDGEVRAKIKLFRQESSSSAGLVNRRLRDLEDDGEVNESDEDKEEDEDEGKDEDEDEKDDDDKPRSATSSAKERDGRGDQDDDDD